MLLSAPAPVQQTTKEDCAFMSIESITKLEEVLQGEPSREAWLDVCAYLEATDGEAAEALTAISAQLERWPSSLRAAPLHWIFGLVDGSIAMAKLGVCSSLSLAPVCYPDKQKPMSTALRPEYEQLQEWVQGLDETAPALEGIHIGLRQSHREAIAANVPTEKTGEFEWQGRHYEDELVEALLGSPLARELRVLDLSLDEPRDSNTAGSQETLDGRFVGLNDLGTWLSAPAKLEVIDLHGHYSSSGRFGRWPDMPGGPKKPVFLGLRAANLAGGHPYNTADVEVLAKQLKKAPITSLNLAGGPVMGHAEDVPSSDCENADYWNALYPDKLLTSAAAYKKLVKAAPSLQLLVLPDKYEGEKKYDKIGEIEGEIRFASAYSTAAEFPSDWGSHFEW